MKARINSSKIQTETTRRSSHKKDENVSPQSILVTHQPINTGKPTASKPAGKMYSQAVVGKQQNTIEEMLLQIMQRLDKLQTNIING